MQRSRRTEHGIANGLRDRTRRKCGRRSARGERVGEDRLAEKGCAKIGSRRKGSRRIETKLLAAVHVEWNSLGSCVCMSSRLYTIIICGLTLEGIEILKTEPVLIVVRFSLRILSDYQDIIRLFSGYSQDILRILSDYSQDILRILSDYSQDIIRLFSGYYQIILRILSDYSQDILRIFSDYSQDIIRLFSGYYQIIIRLFSGYSQYILRGVHSISSVVFTVYPPWCSQ
jgi:hypothetical protein